MELSRIPFTPDPVLSWIRRWRTCRRPIRLREHRLYQASFLLRDYGWDVEDLNFAGNGNLDLERDPKRA
ncbi:MAG: hypothetical protein IPK19_21590 [Chloroflexi bacterium]|nr:hypothetical protein [Chloroflexota bacterium]